MLEDSSNIRLKAASSFYPRRFGISSLRTHIFGAPKCGKTSIALHYANNFKNPFYIDFNDFRNSLDLIKQALLKISMEKKVDCLVLDNIPHNFNIFPNIENIITINEYSNSNFNTKEILMLNFEEFIGFDKSNQSINHLFNNFLKYGGMPSLINLKEHRIEQAKIDLLNLSFKENQNIIFSLFLFQGQCVSINQIYQSFKKKYIKISKDSIYSLIKDLQNRRILYLVPSFNIQNSPKKLFCFDFSIRNIISYEKNFLATFENMLFIELLSLNKPIFYDKKINLICNNIGYIIAPFKSKEMIKYMLNNIDFFGLEIIVVTLELNDEVVINGKVIIIKSFINLALRE
ncbi:ATP-binding protein [Helicobacter sp. MIT 14-3879]|uniref:ATP-binding protein n=1 Tax=Helicobacter sp. MIT 14-3879 TaxID=2040649 RepID=UPI000E1F2EB3|nr:ATP-binding protein [Helicobacter sp. MIT 14-3879]RDU64014.1 hypothetical protein CQA44_05070 [Helicobacter sp. MIT 14-3879]